MDRGRQEEREKGERRRDGDKIGGWEGYRVGEGEM